jgi:hypothetical protein
MYDYLKKNLPAKELDRWIICTNCVISESPIFNDLEKRSDAGFLLYMLDSEFLPYYARASRYDKGELRHKLMDAFSWGNGVQERDALDNIGAAYFDKGRGKNAEWIERWTNIVNVLIRIHEICWTE